MIAVVMAAVKNPTDDVSPKRKASADTSAPQSSSKPIPSAAAESGMEIAYYYV